MRYWWVNQNQTFRQELAGGYLWSPKRNASGARNPFYESMREVSPGDVIFSFVDTRVAAIGIAKSYCWECPKPSEFGSTGQNWENIGWMSGLEKKCKPAIGSLLEDLCLELDAEHRKFLAEWALKTAMVNSAYTSHARFFTDAECHALRSNNRQIPDGTGVWAGRFTGRTLSAIGSEFSLDAPTAKSVAQGHVFNACVGHLILQVLSLHNKPDITSVSVAASPVRWGNFLVQLWPPTKPKNRKITWPPQNSFAIVENLNFGNLHYARLLDRWKVKDGHSVRFLDRAPAPAD